MPDTRRQMPSPRTSPGDGDPNGDPRTALARAIPRRRRVSWWLGLVLAAGFAAVVTPAITAERWLPDFQAGSVAALQPAPFTVRAPMLAGYDSLQIRGGVVVARGEIASRDEAAIADAIAEAMPRGPVLYLALFALTFVLGAIFTHHMRRSNQGRLLRVQIVSLVAIAGIAVAAKIVLLSTALSALVVPVAVLALVATMALDRVVGLATGALGALIVSLVAPFDVGLAILLLVQAQVAGLMVAERPRRRWLAALSAGLAATLATCATYVLLTYLTTGHPPDLRDPLHAPWLAAAIGPALAAVVAVPLLPIYQLLVGEITQGRLIALEDLSHPLLRQIAERAPGTWQHSLMMANMAEIAANAIGASGRLVRVGAYFHDLGKSVQPKYFIENLEPGETSPHDRLPPEVSCDAIFAHVSEGILAARKARLHERIVDFMHMHHGNGVLEYFWAKCREQGNPNELTIERFRYPGHPPQSRETAILAICDAVEAASRTLTKPDAQAIDSLVQRIVYGKLHLGQLDESGLSMADLRRINDSLRETIRHANHGRILYPWQKAGHDAGAGALAYSATSPRLDSLDRRPGRDSSVPRPHAGDATDRLLSDDAPTPPAVGEDALASTADVRDASARRRAAQAARGPDAAEAARIRAGTARNAHATPPETGPRPHDVDDHPPATSAREPSQRHRVPGGDPRNPRGPDAREPSQAHDGRRAWTERPAESIAREPSERHRVPGGDPRSPRGPDAREPSQAHDGRRAWTERPAESIAREPSERHRASGGDAPGARGDGLRKPVTSGTPPGREMTTLPGRAPGPLPVPLDAITPETTGHHQHPPPPSRRAGTAPPMPLRAPTAPPIGSHVAAEPPPPAMNARRLPTEPPPPAMNARRLPTEPPTGLPVASRTTSQPRAPLVASHTTSQPIAPPTASHATSQPLAPIASQATNQLLAPPTASHATSQQAANRPTTEPPTRTAGPPTPSDLDNATTNPPPLRRAPGGQPAMPMDPAQIAAALSEIVSRVAAAPFGTLRPSDDKQRGLAPGTPTAPSPAQHPEASGPHAREGHPARAHDLETRVTDERGAVAASDFETRVTDERRAAAPSDIATRAADERDASLARGLQDRGNEHENEHERATVRDLDGRITDERRAAAAYDLDASSTEPSMPALEVADEVRTQASPRPASPPGPPGRADQAPPRERANPWSSNLAARVDAALISDEWGKETPVVPPSSAELRSLFGQPDPTREQAVDEIALLQRRAAELAAADPPRRAPHPTAEVDPDDIEAAIELAPPARRPAAKNAIGVVRPKKPE